MDPVTLFESRVANVAEVERYQKPKGVLQALVAGDVCAEWILDQLATDGWNGHSEAPGFATARGSIKAVCRLAESKNGVAVATRHGVEILRVVPPAHPGIPEQLYTVRLPRIGAKIAAVRAGMAGAPMEMPARPLPPAVQARPGAQSDDKGKAT